MAPPDPPVLTRRHLLLGAAGLVVLAGCGGDGGSSSDGGGATGPGDEGDAAGGLGIAEYFPRNEVAAGREVRLAIGLVGADGVTLTDVPDDVGIAVAPAGGEPGPSRTVARHDEGVPRPYYPARVTLPSEGLWELVVTTGDGTVRSAVAAVDHPPVPGPGDRLPTLVTPTTADPRGVDPICTAEPPCPLHERSADEVLAAGRPLALLVSTPAFCDIGVCGPVLDVLLAAAATRGDRIGFVHAEVYTDRTASTTTPTVTALGLTYEPALFLVGSDGVIADRLDVVYDGPELVAALDRLT